ncbi:MAG TPA: 50S ribosomal protein L7ae [Firmicutes bacterium]|nr:50S ribosomal protein L7ae [Bacillota bacterium]
MKKIYSYFGLAQRAGRVASGEGGTQAALGRNKVSLLVIAADASANTLSKFRSLAQKNNVKYCVFGRKDELGQAIGKSPRSVLGILDQNFANVIQTRIRESVQEKN